MHASKKEVCLSSTLNKQITCVRSAGKLSKLEHLSKNSKELKNFLFLQDF